MTARPQRSSRPGTTFNRLSYVERGMAPLMVVRVPVRWIHRVVKATKGIFKRSSHSRKKFKPPVQAPITMRENGTIIAGRLTLDCGDDLDRSRLLEHPLQYPSLPPEVWREVILHATNTYPHPLSIHDLSQPTSIQSQRITCLELARRLHRRSLDIKLRLSTVCHAWQDLCTPLIFRSLRLTSADTIGKLLNLFNADIEAKKNGSQRRSWWVREVWLDANICTCPMHDSPGSLAALLEQLPRLQSLRKFGQLSWNFNEAAEGTQVLERIMPQVDEDGLIVAESGPKHLDWAFTHMWGIQHFLSTHPSLNNTLPSIQTLELRPFFVYFAEPPEQPYDIISHVPNFPSLVSLRLFGSPACLQATQFIMPVLRSLAISFTALDGLLDDTTMLNLLRTHGEHLEELELDVSFFQSSPLYLDEMCPNLRRLQIPAAIFISKRLPPLRHQSLTTIGITGMNKLVHERSHDKFSKRLKGFLEEGFPATDVVQDLSLKSHELRQRSVGLWTAQDALDHRSFWIALVEALEQIGVALVDWAGAPVAGFHDAKYMAVLTSEADEVSQGLICCH